MKGKKILTEICYPGELPEEIRGGLEHSADGLIRTDGRIYLDTGDTILCCDDDESGNELIRSVISGRHADDTPPGDKTSLYKRILQDSRYRPDSELLRKIRTDLTAGYCAVIYRGSGNNEKDMAGILSQMAPLEKTDTVIPMDYCTAAFVRLCDRSSADELREYTEAVIGSMESEGITGIRAGIGRIYTGPENLHKSWQEAKSALATGMRHHEKDSVYEYGKQGLERILDSVPSEKLEEIRQEYRKEDSGNSLSEEMFETVRVFFRNDLNLTAASRELFIHRNTLNYRLDKIRRETGLDLRSFHDAVIFRILYGIRERT